MARADTGSIIPGARYVMSNLNNEVQALRIGLSDDGITWRMLQNESGSFDLFRPPNGDDLRDPSIARIGETWFVCYTSGDFGVIGSPPRSPYFGHDEWYFGLARSTDLIHWSFVANIPVVTQGHHVQCWGPEFYIAANGDAYITCPGIDYDTGVAHEYVFRRTDSTGTNWTAQGFITGASGSGLPPVFLEQFILEHDGAWYMTIHNSGTARQELWKSVVGPLSEYTRIDSGDPGPGYWQHDGSEGVNFLPLGNGHWRIYVSNSQPGNAGRLAYTDSYDDLATAAPLVNVIQDSTPGFLSHGTIVRVAGELQFSSIQRGTDGKLSLRGRAVPNGTHTVLATETLDAPFQPIGTVRAAGDGGFLFEDAAASAFTSRFYRLAFPVEAAPAAAPESLAAQGVILPSLSKSKARRKHRVLSR